MSIRYREIKRRYELDGPDKTTVHLSEALRQGHLRPEDFSIRDLAEALVPDGHEWVHLLDPRSAGSVNVLEAGEAVDVTTFLNITSQERLPALYKIQSSLFQTQTAGRACSFCPP